VLSRFDFITSILPQPWLGIRSSRSTLGQQTSRVILSLFVCLPHLRSLLRASITLLPRRFTQVKTYGRPLTYPLLLRSPLHNLFFSPPTLALFRSFCHTPNLLLVIVNSYLEFIQPQVQRCDCDPPSTSTHLCLPITCLRTRRL